jgi:RNA polymerase sigma-70 factor (ECF subfamily)
MDAFNCIYDRYWKQLYYFIYKRLGSKVEAEEVFQDLMISLWKNRETSNIQNLRVYLLIAARNLSNKTIQSKINFRKFQEHLLLNKVISIVQDQEFINYTDFTKALDRVISSMPEKTAVIFRLNKFEELPVKKIAINLQISEKVVEYHLTKSMKIIKENASSIKRSINE